LLHANDEACALSQMLIIRPSPATPNASAEWI
jgi:hypothetical protein